MHCTTKKREKNVSISSIHHRIMTNIIKEASKEGCMHLQIEPSSSARRVVSHELFYTIVSKGKQFQNMSTNVTIRNIPHILTKLKEKEGPPYRQKPLILTSTFPLDSKVHREHLGIVQVLERYTDHDPVPSKFNALECQCCTPCGARLHE